MGELLVNLLGQGWCREQLAAAANPPHPIHEWYRATMEWQQQNADDNNRVRARMSGPARAWFMLAYDVWILQHYFLLAPLLDRLRDPWEFQGARYELTTYALFVRAGFQLQRDPETDNRAGKHVEFFATRADTGERVAVEAKSRRRPGVLGFTAAGHEINANPAPNVIGLLRDALGKRPNMPYVICIETNLPPTADDAQERERRARVEAEVEAVVMEYLNNSEPFPATLVMLTNYAHHYGLPNAPDPGGDHGLIEPARVAHPFVHVSTEKQLIAAMDAYGNLPNSWDDFG
jgi:hypothetical protein